LFFCGTWEHEAQTLSERGQIAVGDPLGQGQELRADDGLVIKSGKDMLEVLAGTITIRL
jgi:hypothetical protein